jgi:hypothetical protein
MKALRQAGCSVADTHVVGHGFPDIVVSRAGVNYLLEIKQPGEHLNDNERCWQAFWRAPVATVDSIEAALRVVGIEESTA